MDVQTAEEINVILAHNDHVGLEIRLRDFLANQFSDLSEAENVCERVKILIASVMAEENIPLAISRRFLSEVLEKSEALQPKYKTIIVKHILTFIHARQVSFEDQMVKCYSSLAAFFEKEGDYEKALEMLQSIPFDTAQRTYSSNLKFNVYVSIADLALRLKEGEKAESYITRASILSNSIENDDDLISFKAQLARVLEFRGKYADAAQKYYELSFYKEYTEAKRIDMLTKAGLCAIFALPGVRQSRMLSVLYKDERTESLYIYSVLEKLYLEKIVSSSEIKSFDVCLSNEINETNGCKALSKALEEHNLIAASKLFASVPLPQLALAVGSTEQAVENALVEMIMKERIVAYIDQVSGLVYFDSKSPLSQWDSDIALLCSDINDVAESILKITNG